MSQPTQEELEKMSPEEIMELQKKNCIFCKMISGEIPTFKVYEDNKCFAILDINPAEEGHILLLPKEHYQILPQVPNEVLEHLMIISKKLSQALLAVFKLKGTSIFFEIGEAAGQKAPHVMAHIIPARDEKIILKPKQSQQDFNQTTELLNKLRQKLGFNPDNIQEKQRQTPKVNKEEKEKISKEFENKNKVAKAEIKKEKDYLYNIDKDGDVSKAKMKRGRKKSPKIKIKEKTKKLKKDKKEDIDLDSVSKLFK